LSDLLKLLKDPAAIAKVEETWKEVSERFEWADRRMPERFMERTELSFHPFVKLLGFVCLDLKDTPGDVLEIGVWKGKSLTLMRRLTPSPAKVIGIDPCELPGQDEEIDYFWRDVFPDCRIVKRYSEEALPDTLKLSHAFKLLHIDGGYTRKHIWTDFLFYERFVVPGGYIVFDDYADHEYSPEVGPAVDALREAGLFEGYRIIGQPPGYELSYVLQKTGSSGKPKLFGRR
jgi:hypothetical protein